MSWKKSGSSTWGEKRRGETRQRTNGQNQTQAAAKDQAHGELTPPVEPPVHHNTLTLFSGR